MFELNQSFSVMEMNLDLVRIELDKFNTLAHRMVVGIEGSLL